MITLKEVLAQMRLLDNGGKPLAFDISVYTLNRNSKTGGRLIHYKNARLLQAEKKEKKTNYMTQENLEHYVQTENKARKNPHHFKNATRNIELETGEIKKIHIRFIDTFNQKKVVY